MRKIFTLLIVAILATATSWAAEYTITFGNKATQPTELLASVKASTAITGGLDYVTAKPFTENLGKSYYGGGSTDDNSSIRVGKSKNAATLSIALSESGQVKASSIVVNCKQMSDNNAGTLAVNGLTAQKFPSSASDLTYTFSEPTDIASIQLKATKSVYVYSITVTYTDSPEPQKTVKSLAITGEPTNKEYFVGDAFSTDGLKVNATYDDDTQEDVTAKATWTRSPATFTEAGAVSVTATASYGGVSASTSCPVTVKTIANTKETAYTVAEAIKLIDNGKTDVRVYVKGIVSKIVTPYSTQYKNITFNVSDDGATTTPQFQFFRNQKDAEHTYAEDPKIEVGATVIGYGILKKFNDTYEFDKGNYLVEYTAPFVPTYTYTWMVNGAEVKKSVLKAGAAVEAPANPENIDGKVFTGWVTTATVDANKKPEYATIDATAKANTTYYAVFATLKQGAGEKWVKKTASEITVEGVYALITKDGKAFNGTIIDASGSAVVKGNGESTTDAFIFDSNNEATSAPEGTCELTFVKSGEGFKMLNADKTQCLYSYQNAKESLSWKAAEKENSYWLFYDDNWAYKQSATTYTYLRVYNSTFRTYTGNNSNEDMYFAQKVAGAGYADFTTIVKAAEVTTLANLAVNGAEGTAYQVNDEMVVAKKFQKAGKNYIVVKDAAQAVRNFSTPAAADKFFNINGNKQEEYTKNNWMLVSLPTDLYSQVNEKSTVTSITGSLTEKFNVAMEATKVVFENVTNDFTPNTYCPINFMGESSVKGTNPAYTSSYYFATPKANEYANVVWAVYNSNDGAFYLPSHTTGSANAQEFKAAFNVDYSLNSVDNPALKDGEVYSFEALVKEVAVPTTDAKSAPRKTAYDSTVAPSTKFVVYPLDLDANKVATGVNDVNSAKEVKGVSYFNMMGVESAQPFDGVNIMVTTYTDGTSSAAKVLR